ncbi:unnamed protein product [Rotaria sp. Silwood2]|nr:unnamed protein product [Rotaria sp. Silwood2]CAF4380043.1 unnamed protein product [Rotaria sp. Silwood2]
MDIHIVSNQHKKCEYLPYNISNGVFSHIYCNDDSDENNTFQSYVYLQCPKGKFAWNNFRFIENFKCFNEYNDCNVTDEISCPPRICYGTDSMKYSNSNICILYKKHENN